MASKELEQVLQKARQEKKSFRQEKRQVNHRQTGRSESSSGHGDSGVTVDQSGERNGI